MLKFLQESQQLPVFNFDPLEMLELEETFEENHSIIPFIISEPLGFALLVSNQENVLNLIPKKSIKELKFKRKKVYLSIASFCIALLPIFTIIKTLKSEENLLKYSKDLKRD